MNASKTIDGNHHENFAQHRTPPARRALRPRPASATTTDNHPPERAESADAYHLYLREIGCLPLLTPEEEITLTRRARRGDDDAREAMIKGNLRLVVKIARDYESLGVPLLDLIAEGNVGLMKAVDRFDPSRGVWFSVYAAFWIKHSIRRALGNQSRTIRVPIHVHGQIFGLERLTRQLHELLGRAPTDAELAHEAGLPPAQLAKLRLAMIRQTSLDAPLGDDPESSLAEVVPDEHGGTPYENLAGETLRELLREFLGDLSAREAYVLRLRYGLEGGEDLTLQEVADKLKLCRERVRQIQETAIKKLHRWITTRETAHVAA